MIRSETLTELAPALVAAQGEFDAIEKTAKNTFFSSMYADLASVVKAATPILSKNGLAVTQLMGTDTLTTILLHKSGEYLGDEAIMHLARQVKGEGWVEASDPQAQGSAVTYMRRYAYMAILGLVADVDDDGNAASLTQSKAAHPSTQKPVEHRPSPITPIRTPRPVPAGVAYLTVPFKDKDAAKELGARWDGAAPQPDSNKTGRWYIPEGIDPMPLLKWVGEDQAAPPQDEMPYADEEPF